MKTFVILVALCGVVCGNPMEYANGDPACERLNVDATFATTAMKGQTEIDSNTVTTNSMSFASGTCTGNSSSVLRVTFNETGAKWTLTFMANGGEPVDVRMIFQYSAESMFPGKNLTDTVILSQDGKLVLSTPDKSFKCDAEETIEFGSFTTSGNNYTVSLKMKGLQVQAFNLPPENFSGATVCGEDTTTSSKATTTTTSETTPEETTSTEEPTTTEESSSTATTAASTSTMAPNADVNTYTVKDGAETCIIMTAAISLSVEYETKDNKTETAKFSVPKTATATGSCGNSSEVNGTLTVKFDNNTIDFVFMDSENKVEIEAVTLNVIQDARNFPNAKNANQTMTLPSTSALALSDDTTYFVCNNGDMVKLKGGSSLDLTELKVQAFNLKNNSFTGTGDECDADKSSTGVTSTTMKPTTPKPTPSNPPVNSFSLRDGPNVTCLLMNASFVLDITYTMKNGTKGDVSLVVPSLKSNDYNGTCGNVTETLNIMFFDTWMLTFVFSEQDGVSASDDLGAVEEYALTNVTLEFQYDERLPDANRTGESETARASDLNLYTARVDGSYKCNADAEITADNGVKMTVSNFQYQAFQTGNSDQFNTGNLNECEADTETNSIVPIAVGAALAGLVVIVLIAYLIGRRKSRRAGYESV